MCLFPLFVSRPPLLFVQPCIHTAPIPKSRRGIRVRGYGHQQNSGGQSLGRRRGEQEPGVQVRAARFPCFGWDNMSPLRRSEKGTRRRSHARGAVCASRLITSAIFFTPSYMLLSPPKHGSKFLFSSRPSPCPARIVAVGRGTGERAPVFFVGAQSSFLDWSKKRGMFSAYNRIGNRARIRLTPRDAV